MKLQLIFSITFLVLHNTNLIKCDKPVHQCTRSGTTCTFTGIKRTLENFDWQPTADEPSVVLDIQFTSCTLPVLIKDICDTFPFVKRLEIIGQGVVKIQENAFKNCKNLEFLWLYNNLIESIPKNTFLYTTNMKDLRLNANQIKKLDDYYLLSNMPNLTLLEFGRNNLTYFSPELIKHNNKLVYFYLYSNDLSDIEAETILGHLPNVKEFGLDDNEIACTRIVEIYTMLALKSVKFDIVVSIKIRYYTQKRVFGNLKCNADIDWMASNYRKENILVTDTLKKLQNDGKILQKQLIKNDNKIGKIDNRFDKIKHRFDRIEEKYDKIAEKFDQLEIMLLKLLNQN